MIEENAAARASGEPAVTATRVCVAIPTFRRPEPLERLLRAVARLRVPADCSVDVLVMDNDGAPRARDVALRAADWLPLRLSYVHVREPGLSSVRNFALGWARDGFDFLAMIDDDEIPDPEWLSELLRVQRRANADAVVGPVPAVLPRSAPRWLRAGRFFDLPAYRDEELISDGYSGNCLIRVRSIEHLGLLFDPGLNFAGGEDLLFFRGLCERGGRLAYAARAVAWESVGPERTTAAYILRLNFRRGNTLALCDRRLHGGRRASAGRALKACGRIALGCASLVPQSILRGATGTLSSLRHVALGLGALAGLFGYTYRMYGREP